MTGKKRAFTSLIAVLIAFVMLSSVMFIAAESAHDCSGENCQICYQISVCENTLKQLSLAIIAVAIASALAYILIGVASSFIRLPVRTTLIILRVKLSN